MVVIFGWGAGDAKDLGEIAPTTCPNCHNGVFLHHIRTEKQVSLYFVTMASYGGNEYLACPICRNALQLRPEHRPAVDSMRAGTSLYRKGGLGEDAYRGAVARFWATIGVAPSGQQVLHPATPGTAASAAPAGAPTPAGAGRSLADQLADLGQLHADGVLTDDEFASAKRRLIGS